MRPTAADRVAWSVCLSVTIMSPAKAAEPIGMPFGMWTRLGPSNHLLDEGRSPHAKWQFFEGERGPDQDI